MDTATINNLEITEKIVTKLISIVTPGLSVGLGSPKVGQMCVEAAVCFAYGLPHSDNPPCVGAAIRAFKIRLNDCNWSSNQVRAKGMLALSIAQLNSNVLDQKEFSKKIVIKIINNIIADLAKTYLSETEQQLREVNDLSIARELCIKLKTKITSAIYAATNAAATNAAANAAAANAAANATIYAATATAYAAAYAADAANAAADTTACAAAYAADAAYAAANAVTNAAYAAANAAYAAANTADAAAAYAAANAADAAAYAADAAAYGENIKDKILFRVANLCLEVLKEMKSPGCEFLYLIKNN